MDAKPGQSTASSRDQRYRLQFFPRAGELTLDTKAAGFVPLPIVLRKLIHLLPLAEFRLLIYLHLRASRWAICYPPLDEIVHDLRLSTKKRLVPQLNELERKNFISSHTAGGRQIFLVHDPRHAIAKLAGQGAIDEELLAEINDLYADLRQPPVEAAAKKSEQGGPGANRNPPGGVNPATGAPRLTKAPDSHAGVKDRVGRSAKSNQPLPVAKPAKARS